MDSTQERTDTSDASRRVVEIALAGLLHDVGKIFQRAEWPLSQAAEKLQDDLCPVVDGRAVHRHVLWTYDFCNDNLKWLAEYVDLARVMKLATGHHRLSQDDPAAFILDVADRIASGAESVEVEELQPAIPPQVPMESIFWNYTSQEDLTVTAPMKSRRRRRSATSESAATGETGQEPQDATETPADESPATPDDQHNLSDQPAGQESFPLEGPTPAPEPAVAPADMPRFDVVRRAYFTGQPLRSDEDVLPSGKRPEMNEQNYRELGTDLVAAVQRIGRITGKPRLGWLIEALRNALESRMSLVPAHVGAGGQTVSLYSHAVAMSSVAAALWKGYESTGSLPAGSDAKAMSLTIVQLVGVEEYLCRPAPTENSSRVYHGRAAMVRLITRLLGDVLLRDMGLPTVSRLYEADDCLVILGESGESADQAVQKFIAEQGAQLFAQTGGYLRLVAAGPLALSNEQLGRTHWGSACRELETQLIAAKSQLGQSMLQANGQWREDAAVLNLTDRHGQALEPGQWARLQEAYERQLGTNLARGKAIAAYSSPVTPTGVEGEATVIGPWFVHVGASPQDLLETEGLEQIYSVGEPQESYAWLPTWHSLPHGPTYRRADESQLRADNMPSGWQMAAGTKRRDMAIGFEELGWLARRSRKGRGFVGRSWLGCLTLEADGVRDNWCSLVRYSENFGQIVETGRQALWFWQDFVEGQLRRADRATWRVFVLRSSLGRAILIGPWNTMMVLASRAEQWWRRWAGPTTLWPVRGALAFGPRDVPAWQLVWQADEGMIQAEPGEGAGRVWLLDRVRNWSTYREALRLSNLLDEHVQSPEVAGDEDGLVFLRRLMGHEREAQRVVTRASRGAVLPWRAGLATDVRKLVLKNMPRRGKRTALQEDLIEQLQALISTGRRGKFPTSVGLAARIALWQNQGETS